MSKPVKRRIQPQLVSPSYVPRTAARPNAALNESEVLVQNHPASGPSRVQQKIPDPKEDSETAASLGMKGRRIFVTLNTESQEINFKKVGILLTYAIHGLLPPILEGI